MKKTKKILSKLDNERLAITAVAIIGLSLLLFLIIAAPELLESEWFLNVLTVLAEYGSFIAGGAYIGRLFNLFTARLFTENNKEKTKVTTFLNKKVVMGRLIKKQEKELTPIGMLLGMAVAITCIVLHVTVPFLSVFSYFAYVLFILGYACALGGLFNRLGSSMDGSRLPQEKGAILFGAIFGLVFALSLIAILAMTGTLPLVAVAGVSKVFFDLFLLHKTLFAITFILSLTSLTTSFFDYFAKAVCFLNYKFNWHAENKKINTCVESRYHEYRGAFLGLMTGGLLAISIITGLAVTGGLIATPIAVGATLFLTTITCGSVVSALFSRIGRVIDGVNRTCTPPALVEKKDTYENSIILISDGTDIRPTSERRAQVHPHVLINKASSLVLAATESSNERAQEQPHPTHVMEAQIEKGSVEIFRQNITSFYPPDKKRHPKVVGFSKIDGFKLSCS